MINRLIDASVASPTIRSRPVADDRSIIAKLPNQHIPNRIPGRSPTPLTMLREIIHPAMIAATRPASGRAAEVGRPRSSSRPSTRLGITWPGQRSGAQ